MDVDVDNDTIIDNRTMISYDISAALRVVERIDTNNLLSDFLDDVDRYVSNLDGEELGVSTYDHILSLLSNNQQSTTIVVQIIFLVNNDGCSFTQRISVRCCTE